MLYKFYVLSFIKKIKESEVAMDVQNACFVKQEEEDEVWLG